MPRRDRKHELETESQRAFESALPSNLVARQVTDDYGVDREVEVFEGGKTTGLTIKVQLKGTDKSGTTRRIKREHLDYWNSLDVPVLIVSYEAPTKTLRARWVHSIGTEGPDSGAKTHTIHMDPEIDIAGKWPASLAEDLRVLRALKRGDLPTPTPIRVETSASALVPATDEELLAALLIASRRSTRPMRAVQDDAETALVLTLRESTMRVALPLALSSCTYHLTTEALSKFGLRDLGDLALMVASQAVSPLNEDLARRWIKGVGPSCPGWASVEFAERLGVLVAAPECVGLVLDVHARLVEHDEPAADLYVYAVMEVSRPASVEKFEAYSDRIRRKAAAAEQTPSNAARLRFNLAQSHRHRKEYAIAVELFESAGTYARYQGDALFLRALGGCYFDLGNDPKAAEVYRIALGLGFDPHELVPLVADSLMWSGEYARAREALNDWTPAGTDTDRFGLLLGVALDHVTEVTAMASQNRHDYDSKVVLNRYNEARDADDLTVEVLSSLLIEADALHPTPWMHLAELPTAEGGQAASAIVFAMLTPDIPHAWTLALLRALDEEMPEEIVRAIVNQGRFHADEEFYDSVLMVAEQQEPEEARVLRALISAAFSAEPGAFISQLRVLDMDNLDLAASVALAWDTPVRGYA